MLPVDTSGETDGDAIQMAFSKKAVEDRKQWLSNFVPGTFLDSEASKISYSDFVHKVCCIGSSLFSSGLVLQPLQG